MPTLTASVRESAGWSDVTSPPSIIARSVGGGGKGSRETEVDGVSERERKKHTHTS